IALYRPGPLDLIPDFLARRKGQSAIQYEHPLLEEVSSNTYGILIYQEQVQKAASVLAGYTLAEADLLRRAMGKKDKDQMAAERVRFREGCQRLNGIPAKKADAIFDLLERFAGYGFNKSHSAAYAVLCFRTAYLKANYTVEFMSALMSSEVDDTEKITELVAECQRMGLRVLPPDVNASALKFQPEIAPGRMKAIRFGLLGIKNVGTKAVHAIVTERNKGGPYKSLEDFARRVDSRDVSRKVVECLVKCGAFDSFGKERQILFAGIEAAMTAASAHQRDLVSGQGALFDAIDLAGSSREVVGNIPDWSARDLLAFEKELLGFYVTGHPLDEYRGSLEASGMIPISALSDAKAADTGDERPGKGRREGTDNNRRPVKIGGALIAVDKRYTKGENKPFAFLQLEDLTGVVEVCCWTETFSKYQKLLEVGKVVAISGTLDPRSESPKVIASEVALLKPKAGKKPGCLRLRLHLDAQSFEEELEEVAILLRNHPGSLPVEIELMRNGHLAVVEAGKSFSVVRSQQLIEDLKPWLVKS
ncbi:MAG: OB-fold nucleic acid binding domain-containing protein, partial [Verrucomicrobiia bacterium]